MQTGSTYGYRALVNLDTSSKSAFTGLSTKKGYMPGDLMTALQADLALAGLLVTQYKVTGKTPNYGIALEIQPAKGFFSTQSVKQIVDTIIKQQTGKAPAWSEDPCCCVVTPPTIATCCCVTKATLAMISGGGKNAFAPGGTCNKTVTCASPSLLGEAYGGGTTVVNKVGAGLSAVGSALKGPFEILLIAVFALAVLFVVVKAL